MSFEFENPSPRPRQEMPLWAWLVVVVAVFFGGLGGLAWFVAQRDHRAVAERDAARATAQGAVATIEPSAPRTDVVAADPAQSGMQTASGMQKTEAQRPQSDSESEPDPAEATRAKGSKRAGENASLAAKKVVSELKFGVVHITSLNSEGKEIGFGSGFVIDASGLVATNFHVIRNSSNARVAFQDGKTFEVKGSRAWDADGDLAILELADHPEEMQVLTLSESTDRDDAAAVIAIGHPKGFKFTTTTGIISAVHKTTELPEPYRGQIQAPADNTWIQTNAAISGGSSGGPLLTTNGEVVGINTWIVRGESLGFAVDVRHLVALKENLRDEAMPLADLTGPEEHITRIETDFDNQYLYFAQQYREAKSDAARKALIEARHPASDFAERLCDLADKHKGTPSHFSALLLACRIAGSPEAPEKCGPVLKRAGDLLLAEYGKDQRLLQAAFALRTARSAGGRDLLKRISESEAEPQVRGMALYCLAMTHTSARATSDEDEEDETPASLTDEGLAVLERVSTEYADVNYGGRSLGEAAKGMLYSLKNLAIGRPALEIEGTDATGKTLKLSEFRGKVVVVDFWADWCPYCVEMYPHEREWVKELADKPFALVGINCDEPARFKRVVKAQKMTWTNFGDGAHGPIADAWRIQSFPSIFILDHNGVIRARDLRGDELTAMVKKLMAAVPGEAAVAELPAGELPASAEVPE